MSEVIAMAALHKHQTKHTWLGISHGTLLTGAIFVFLFISLKNRLKKKSKTTVHSDSFRFLSTPWTHAVGTRRPLLVCETGLSEHGCRHSAHTVSPVLQPGMVGRLGSDFHFSSAWW